jgi:uncharacterized membrane protein
MRARTRKLIGTTLLLVLIPVYGLVVVAAAGAMMTSASILVQSLFFLVTGLVWVLPAMALISWMSRPDRAPNP